MLSKCILPWISSSFNKRNGVFKLQRKVSAQYVGTTVTGRSVCAKQYETLLCHQMSHSAGVSSPLMRLRTTSNTCDKEKDKWEGIDIPHSSRSFTSLDGSASPLLHELTPPRCDQYHYKCWANIPLRRVIVRTRDRQSEEKQMLHIWFSNINQHMWICQLFLMKKKMTEHYVLWANLNMHCFITTNHS